MSRKRKSVSTSSSTRHGRSRSSINDQSENGSDLVEVGLSVEDEQENSIENMNENYIQDGVVGEETNENSVEDNLNQDGVADEESNANADEDENFGFINDDKREVGIHEDEEINGS